MRTISLFLLFALTALVESRLGKHLMRAKPDILVRSKRRWVLSTIEIEEEDRGPFPKEISRMFNDKTDAEGQKYRISGMGVTEEPLGVFSIDENTGVVYSLKPVDRETYKLFNIKFDILSKLTGKEIDKELAFNVEVKDINDNPPTFSHLQMEVNVMENLAEGSLPVHLLAMDRDLEKTNNSKITISMVSQNPQEPKIELQQIGDTLASLTFKGCFDYDKVKKYEITVLATDHGTPSLSSSAIVILNIVDTNSHPPTFKEKKYQGEVLESITKDNVLRIAVDDKDTPKTPGWRAKYFFIKGNEGGNYHIETDPDTNEGVISVIKANDFETTPFTVLQVGVKNEESLNVCIDKSLVGESRLAPPETVNVTMKVTNVNDPPYYEKVTFDVYQKEEEEPGKELLSPKIYDADSNVSNIRHVLLEDPAGWVTIDEKTGKLTTAKKMDRESPFVDDNGLYKIVICAIDDGKPPATATSTVLVHLQDINDNTPKLVNNSVILCGNKDTKVMVMATDKDAPPFSGPFAFSLGDDDKTLKQRWKLDPANGEKGGIVSLKTLPYGNYSVPLVIQDQQSLSSRDTVAVMVCDCGEGDVCRSKKLPSSSLGAPGIGLLFLGLLLFLLLLLLVACQCGRKEMNILQDEGNQTLIKYNQEGGGSACNGVPTLLLTPTNSVAVTNGLKTGTMQMSQVSQVMAQDMDTFDGAAINMAGPVAVRTSTLINLTENPLQMSHNMTSMGTQRTRDTFRSNGGQNIYSIWKTNRTNTYQGGSSTFNRSLSLRSSQHIADHIDRRLHTIGGQHGDHPVYLPYEYAYEGQGSKCQSLDELSLNNLGDDLIFLDDLGPKFKTLAGICQQTIQEKNIQL